MARTHRSPDGTFASGGAVRQHDGKLPIYVCNDCGREVVWVTGRTGRKYLANISHGSLGQRFYIGANVHQCDRSLTPEVRAERETDQDIYAAREYAAWHALMRSDSLREQGKIEEARELLRSFRASEENIQ